MTPALPKNRTLLLGILACAFVAAFLALLTITREQATVWPAETLIPTLDGGTIAITEGEQNALAARLVGKDVNNVEIHRFEKGEGAAGFAVVANMHNLLQCPEGARAGTVEALYGILNDRSEREWAYVYDGSEAARKAEGKIGEALFPRPNFWVSKGENAISHLESLRNFQGNLSGKIIYLMSAKAHLVSCFDTDHDRINDRQEDTDNNGQRTTGETNLVDADSDDDGLIDGDEIEKGTNPLQVDTDNDGVQDGTELGVATPHADTIATVFRPDLDPATKTDPLVADSDGDTLKDGEEDSNGNGAEEAVERGETDPSDADSDEDGVPDATELHSTLTRPHVIDTDGDGIQDGTELGYVSCPAPAASLGNLGSLLVAQTTGGPEATIRVTPERGAFDPMTEFPVDVVLDANTDEIAAVEVRLLAKDITLLRADAENPPSAFEIELEPVFQTAPDANGVSIIAFSRLSFEAGKRGAGLQVIRLIFQAPAGAATLDFDTMPGGTQVIALDTSEAVTLATRNGNYTIATANLPPTLTVPGPQEVAAGQTLAFTVSAADSDGGPQELTLTALNPPQGSTFAGLFFGSLLLVGSLGAMGFDRRKLLIAASIAAVFLLVLILRTEPWSRFRGQILPPIVEQTFTWTPTAGEEGAYTVTFEAGDGAATTRADVVITVTAAPPVNQAPTVDAGFDQMITLPANTVTLSATVGDDGLPDPPRTIAPQWSMVSGPAPITFADANALSTTATFSIDGIYVLRLIGSDSELFASDDLTVTVNPPVNQSPTADAGVDQIITLPVNSVPLDGTVSDDGLPNPPGTVTTQWRAISAPAPVNLGDENAIDTTAAFSVEGMYVLQLTADDGALQSGDDLTVTVLPAIAPPTLIIQAPQAGSLIEGSTVQVLYSAGGTLTEGDHVHLSLDNPAAPDRDLDFDGSFTYTNVAEGAHTITAYLARTDHSQIGESVSVSFTVVYNRAPTVSAGADQTITLPIDTVQLDGGVSDDGLGGGIVSVQWSMVSGPGTVTFTDANAPATTATFSDAGTYMLRLTAADTELSASDDAQVTVNPASQTPRLIIESPENNSTFFGPDVTSDVDIFYAITGDITEVNRIRFRLDSEPPQFDLSLEDGTYQFADVPVGQHTVTAFLARADATQIGDAVSVSFGVAAVPAENQPPTVSAGPDQTVAMGTTVTLDGTVSDDGLPNPPGAVTMGWLEGPVKPEGGTVTFADPTVVDTTATFSAPGRYELVLTVHDGEAAARDIVVIYVGGAPLCASEDTDGSTFIPDAHPASVTDPLRPDTDHGGTPDGAEDANRNGHMDSGETDPLDSRDDDRAI